MTNPTNITLTKPSFGAQYSTMTGNQQCHTPTRVYLLMQAHLQDLDELKTPHDTPEKTTVQQLDEQRKELYQAAKRAQPFTQEAPLPPPLPF